jgi:hypothetical protein
MEVSGQLQAPTDLPPGKSKRYPLDSRVGGLQSRSGRGGKQKSLITAPAGDWTPVVQSVV